MNMKCANTREGLEPKPLGLGFRDVYGHGVIDKWKLLLMVWGLGIYRGTTQITMEHQMDRTLDNEMESGCM